MFRELAKEKRIEKERKGFQGRGNGKRRAERQTRALERTIWWMHSSAALAITLIVTRRPFQRDERTKKKRKGEKERKIEGKKEEKKT